ncbi:MAG: lysophospholipid acyltransferase family protein [Chitinivibrionales bacterium]
MSQFFKDVYHAIIWQLSRLFVFMYLRPLFKVEIEKDSDPVPSTPFIMISNHGTFFDPWLIGATSATPLAIMMNDDGFRAGGFTRWYLHSVGAFPKKKGAHDFTAMKKTLQTLKRGKPVFIFPEGQTTWNGETQPIFGGIEKIVKKAQCNLYMSRVKGNFLSMPWWAKTRRRGKVLIRYKTISRDQIAQMSAEQILHTMIDYIHVNDIEDHQIRQIRFTGEDMAEGMERLVWLCPKCKSEDTLVASHNKISCSSCSLVITTDAYCKLFYSDTLPDAPENLYEWTTLHKQYVKTRISHQNGNMPLTSSSDITMSQQDENKDFVAAGSGTLRLTQDFLTFTPTNSPEAEKKWSLASITDYVIQKKDIFEFHHTESDEYFRFEFDHKSPMKWIYYLRYINGYEQCEEKGYM